MKIFSISLFKRKQPIQKVFISPKISQPEYVELASNRGYMDEFMRKKKFDIKIDKSFFQDSKRYLDVHSCSPTRVAVYSIPKDGDESLIARMMKLLYKISEDFSK